jgi:hypothetical protein
MSKVNLNELNDILNNPQIPNSYKEYNYNFKNPNLIEYLDNDIYNINNNVINKNISNFSKYLKNFLIILISILGIFVFIEFKNDPKNTWNLLILYIIICVILFHKFKFSNQFLVFNKINSIDNLFPKTITL